MRSLLIGGALGAAVAYLLDPEQGPDRRARWVAALGSLGGAPRLALLAEPEGDLTVLSRAESVLYALPGFPRYEVELEVVDGRLVLRGEVAGDEQAQQIAQAAEAITGVVAVDSRLRARAKARRGAAPA